MLLIAGGAVAAIAAGAPESTAGRAIRKGLRRAARRGRYVVHSAPGIAYRLSGGRPDPDVDDDVLADRIRSQLGPLERRLDVPRVHVMVDDHVAILHGSVGSEADALRIEDAVANVSGVRGVESHLHVGLGPGDTRPSQGATTQPSVARRVLLDAAHDAGAHEPERAVRAVLAGFMDRLPVDEAEHLLSHLPADVRALAERPRRRGERPARLKTVPQLVAAAIAHGGLEADAAERITRSVIATLRNLVPEEARDVSAVLPAELRELWESQPTTVDAAPVPDAGKDAP
jgi:uncharacterized protein (DUF2267 family)